ncbi:MAG: flippase-like domain-containing protein [Chloroflexales bacterium]|nr:flippase-like domain-containing protein [Chloroflexales bacterium]
MRQSRLHNLTTRVTALLRDERLRQNRWVQRAVAAGWLLLSVALVVWFSGSLQRSWLQLASYRFTWRLGYVWPALLCYGLAQALLTLNWSLVARRVGAGVPWRNTLTAYSYSFFLSGLPGGFWNIFSLFYFYAALGVSRSLVLLGAVIEQVSMLLAGVLICIVIVPFTLQPVLGGWTYGGAALGLALLGLGAAPPVWQRMLGALARLRPFAALGNATLRFRDMALWVALQVGAILASCLLAFFCVNVMQPLPLDSLPLVVASWSLIITISALVYWVPGTSGLQLGLSLFIFSTFLDPPIVLALLVMLRLVRIAGSSAAVVVAFALVDLPRFASRKTTQARSRSEQ